MKRTVTAYIAMNPNCCKACWKCVGECPKKVIGKAGRLWHRHVAFINEDACIGCGKCIRICPNKVFCKLDKPVAVRKTDKGISYWLEFLLPVAFVALAVTGIGLHIAGHGANLEAVYKWGIAHIVASSFWLLSGMAHIKRHLSWYRALLTKGLANKRWIVCAVSLLFITVAVTGFLLMSSMAHGASLGLLHYKLGLLLLVFSVVHTFYHK